MVSAASQPDWYVMFLDGLVRLMPAWEINIPIGDGYGIPPLFWPAVVLPGVADHACRCSIRSSRPGGSRTSRAHHLLQRPRDVPERTGLGAMAFAFFVVLTLSGGNDVIADKFHISLNAMTWAGRIGLLILPPLAYYLAVPDLPGPAAARPRGAGARRGDRHHPAAARRPVLEVHQPLGPVDDHGHPASWTTPAGSCRRR